MRVGLQTRSGRQHMRDSTWSVRTVPNERRSSGTVQQRVEGEHMATRSYYEDLILNTPEAIANMEKAFERAERGW